jgi:hypothetical protein
MFTKQDIVQLIVQDFVHVLAQDFVQLWLSSFAAMAHIQHPNC